MQDDGGRASTPLDHSGGPCCCWAFIQKRAFIFSPSPCGLGCNEPGRCPSDMCCLLSAPRDSEIGPLPHLFVAILAFPSVGCWISRLAGCRMSSSNVPALTACDNEQLIGGRKADHRHSASERSDHRRPALPPPQPQLNSLRPQNPALLHYEAKHRANLVKAVPPAGARIHV